MGLWLTNWSNIGPKIMAVSLPWVHKSLSAAILLPDWDTVNGLVEDQLTSPYQPERRTVSSRRAHSFIDTNARLQRGATWCVRNGASSVHVLANTPGPELGAIFVGKIGRLRAPDNRSEWSAGCAPEDPVGRSRHVRYYSSLTP